MHLNICCWFILMENYWDYSSTHIYFSRSQEKKSINLINASTREAKFGVEVDN